MIPSPLTHPLQYSIHSVLDFTYSKLLPTQMTFYFLLSKDKVLPVVIFICQTSFLCLSQTFKFWHPFKSKLYIFNFLSQELKWSFSRCTCEKFHQSPLILLFFFAKMSPFKWSFSWPVYLKLHLLKYCAVYSYLFSPSSLDYI